MKKVIKIGLIVVVVLVVVGLVALYLSLNSIVKKGVETVGPMATKTVVKVDSVSISPFSGAGQLKGIFVGNPEGYNTESAFKLGDVRADIDVSSVFSDKVVVEEVYVDGPEITYEGSIHGSNIAKIQENVDAFAGTSAGGGPGETTSSSSSQKIQINRFVLKNGKISLSAKIMGGKALSVPLPDIELKDIGKDSDGMTVGEAMKEVFSAVTGGIKDAVKKSGAIVGKGAESVGDAAKETGEAIKEGGKKTVEKVKGIFQKD